MSGASGNLRSSGPGIWRTAKKITRHAAYRWLPIEGALEKPVFVVGCGRSGTTILGRTISQNPAVLYLNEPYDIWFLDPKTDVWSGRASRRSGKLYLTEADVDSRSAQRIRRAFFLHLRKEKKRQFVEKLPINSFRIRYLLALFPDARFIYLLRNGAEVARSIARFGSGQWFGAADYKWTQLARFAEQRGEGHLIELCRDSFSRGLMEWRLSVSTGLDDLKRCSPENLLSLRYETLVEAPERVIESIEDFVGLPRSPEMRDFARGTISRRSPRIDNETLSEDHMTIAGELLERFGYLQRPEADSTLDTGAP